MQLTAVDEQPNANTIAARIAAEVGAIVRGKDDAIRIALVAVLSGSHLLIEDAPGTGKTLLAKSLATAIGGSFRRVQCTPDLLPSDLTGTMVYSPVTGEWQFRPGPVFANVLLADELNRASPRTQAAMLEPLEEFHVTVDGELRPLPAPFMCVATQNPYGSAGTFPLPESQLDRFGLVLRMGLPGRAAERDVLTGVGGSDAFATMRSVASPHEVLAAIAETRSTYVADAITDYVLDIVAATRNHPDTTLGASPRAAKGLLRAAQAHAVITGRNYVSPDDVQAVAESALAHRIGVGMGHDLDTGALIVRQSVATVVVPIP